jgi:hypothetical protein
MHVMVIEDEGKTSDEEQADEIEDIMRVAMPAIVGGAFVLSIFNNDFASFWNLINAIQILHFMPLMIELNLPIQLRKFFIALLDFEMIPNIFGFIMSESEYDTDIPSYTDEFNYDNPVFILCGLLSKCRNQSIASSTKEKW